MRVNFLVVLLTLFALPYGNAYAGILTVFVNSDFTQTESVAGFGWEPGSQVTLEIDNGNDGSVDYQATNVLDPDGVVRFPADGLFAVQEDDLVRMNDNLTPQNAKEHLVDYLTLSEVDLEADTLMGAAREGTEVEVFVWVNGGLVQMSITQADSSHSWFVSLADSGYDIVPGSSGVIITTDDDGDHTSINWLVPAGLTVVIDIKPDSDPNCFNINGNGVVPVSVLGSETFDVTLIDVDTISFEGLDVRVRGQGRPLCSFEDTNDDGSTDLVCHFDDDVSQWAGGETLACVTGSLLPEFGGTAIQGCDSICIVP